MSTDDRNIIGLFVVRLLGQILVAGFSIAAIWYVATMGGG